MGKEIKKKKSIIKEIIDWILHVVAALFIGLFIITFVGQLSIVNKTSMKPTLNNGDLLIVDKITPRFFSLKRGDIVTVQNAHPLLVNETLIKRLIALEGDTIEFIDGKVFLNGEELTEPYINGSVTVPPQNGVTQIVIPKNMAYVLGDNRGPGGSLDSREFGPVPISNINSKAWVKIYPFKEAHFF